MTISLLDANLTSISSAVRPALALPPAVYHAYELWYPERIGALALYCSDGRWGEVFDEFCHRQLQVPHYDRWAVPGGPAWLAGPETELLRSAWAQLDFLVRTHELERIVLVTHFGCAWYGHQLGQPPDSCLTEQSADVRRAAERLRGWYRDLQVEGYLAMRDGRWVSFHEVDV